MKNVTDYIVDVVCKRAEINYNYGVILIPEGLIDFIPEVSITLQFSQLFFYLCFPLCTWDYVLVLFMYNQYEYTSDDTHLYLVLCYMQVQHLIAELNEILAHDTVDEGGLWKKKLTDQSLKLFDFLPQAIQELSLIHI